MERILTKEEIAELLSAVREGEIDMTLEEESVAAERSVSRLDLTRISAPGQRRIGNLDVIFDVFAQNCGISLTNRLQRSVTVRRGAIDSMPFDRLLQGFSGRGAIGIIRLDPLRWGGLINFDEKFCFYLVESLLGGAEGRLMVPDRGLTAIEMHVVRGAISDACSDLSKAFRPLEKLEASVASIERDPRLVNIVPPDAQVLVVRFTLSVGGLSGEMALTLPHASLEPLREKLREGVSPFLHHRSDSWRNHFLGELHQMETEIAAQVGTVVLPVRDILNFQVGDIIELGCDPSAPLRLVVEGKSKFQGHAGVRNGRKAVRLTSRITNGVDHGKKDE